MYKYFLCFLISFSVTHTFNLSPKFIIRVHNPQSENNYFGYTVHLRSSINSFYNSSVIIGAPKANSIVKTKLTEPGSIYQCNQLLSGNATCKELLLGDRETKCNCEPHQEYGDLGLSIDGQNTDDGRFVACSPRWSNYAEGENIDFNLNGICYWFKNTINESLSKSTTPLLPLLDRKQDEIASYHYGQFGFSSHLSNTDGTEIIFGSPGLYSWTGGVVRYNDWLKPIPNNNRYRRAITNEPTLVQYGQVIVSKHEIILPNNLMLTENSYFGYAVSSGILFKTNSPKKRWYVASAPKYEKTGSVFVFDFLDSDGKKQKFSERSLKIYKELIGEQIGEYFGADLCVVDVNGDGLDDILVGAPRYSLERADTDSGDEGAVYVYINQNNWNFQKPYKLQFNEECSSQFGTSLTSLGDLDQDGFNDVVVGAPYENYRRGAIYIYLGSKDGLKSKPSQYFSAKDIGDDLLGFGISLSRGVDIDDNKYNDLAVGSYLSGDVLLIRARPVANLTGKITPSVHKLLAAENFNITACVIYNGIHVPEKINISIDINVTGAVFALNNEQRKHSLTENIEIQKLNNDTCYSYGVFFEANIQDFLLSGVNLIMKLSINEEETMDDSTFCSKCPILHPTSKDPVTVLVPFSNGCANDTCYPELTLSANFTSTAYIIGSNSGLTLNICIGNTGEPALLTKLEIVTNLDDLKLILKPDECDIMPSQYQISTINCTYNILKPNKDINITLVIDTNNIPLGLKTLEVNMEVNSNGIEENQNDNSVSLNLPLYIVSDFKIMGTTSNDVVIFKDNEGALIRNLDPVNYTYNIQNSGPSRILKSEVTFYIPYLYKNVMLFDVSKLEATLGHETLACIRNENVTNFRTNLTIPHRKYIFPLNHTLFFNCSTPLNEITCIAIKCEFGLMENYSEKVMANFSIKLKLEEIVTILEEKRILEMDIFTIVRPLVEVQVDRGGMVVYNMGTTFIGFIPDGVPILWIILAVILGLLVLCAIIGGLMKYGYFHRPHKELMQAKLIKEGSDDLDLEI